MLECVEINPDADPVAVVIWLHGLGADGHDFEPIVPELNLPPAMPVRFLFPHAPRRAVTINLGMVMRAWYDILDMELSRKVDHAGILESAEQLRQLVQREEDAGMPTERIILAGFSQGGVVALHTALRYPRRLAGILALSTYLPTAETLEKERSPENAGTPIMMGHGRFDDVIPLEYARNAKQRLLELNYDLQWQDYPMSHQVCAAEINDIGVWLKSRIIVREKTT